MNKEEIYVKNGMKKNVQSWYQKVKNWGEKGEG